MMVKDPEDAEMWTKALLVAGFAPDRDPDGEFTAWPELIFLSFLFS